MELNKKQFLPWIKYNSVFCGDDVIVENMIKEAEDTKKQFPANADILDENIANYKKNKKTFQMTICTCSTDGCNEEYW